VRGNGRLRALVGLSVIEITCWRCPSTHGSVNWSDEFQEVLCDECYNKALKEKKKARFEAQAASHQALDEADEGRGLNPNWYTPEYAFEPIDTGGLIPLPPAPSGVPNLGSFLGVFEAFASLAFIFGYHLELERDRTRFCINVTLRQQGLSATIDIADEAFARENPDQIRHRLSKLLHTMARHDLGMANRRHIHAMVPPVISNRPFVVTDG
jgi:hypothetical protein